LAALIWIFTSQLIGFFSFLLAAGIGYGIGELISLSVNRKSGTGLAIIGASAVIVCFTLVLFVRGFSSFSLLYLIAPAIAIFVSVARLR
jgi:hypothetical protein